jgi:hypothetical protein
MTDIIVTSDTGLQAIIQQAPPVNIIVEGTLKGDQGDVGDTGPGVPNGGTIGQFLGKSGNANQQTSWQTMPAGNVVINQVTENAHGLSLGQIIRFTTGGYLLSKADTQENSEVLGIVQGIIDANNFIVATEGYVTGLQGFTPGVIYFLSPTYAGQLTSVEPTAIGQFSKPVFTADTTDSGYFHNYRGIRVGS